MKRSTWLALIVGAVCYSAIVIIFGFPLISKSLVQSAGVGPTPLPAEEQDRVEVEPAGGGGSVQADGAWGASASSPCLRAEFHPGLVEVQLVEGQSTQFCFEVENTGLCDWGGMGVYNNQPYSAVRIGAGAWAQDTNGNYWWDNNLSVYSNRQRGQMFPLMFSEDAKKGTYMYMEDPLAGGKQVGVESLSRFVVRWLGIGPVAVGETKRVCLTLAAADQIYGHPNLEMDLRIFIDTPTEGAASLPNQAPNPDNGERWAHGIAGGSIHLRVIWLPTGAEIAPVATPTPTPELIPEEVEGGEGQQPPVDVEVENSRLALIVGAVCYLAITIILLVVGYILWENWQKDQLAAGKKAKWYDLLQTLALVLASFVIWIGFSHLITPLDGGLAIFFAEHQAKSLMLFVPLAILVIPLFLLYLKDLGENPSLRKVGLGSDLADAVNAGNVLQVVAAVVYALVATFSFCWLLGQGALGVIQALF